MPRTVLTIQEISRNGLAPSYVAGDAVNGHSFDNAGRHIFCHIKNGGAAAITATFVTPGTVDGMAIPDKQVSIPAGGEAFVGPFSYVYEQADTANSISKAVFVDLSDATSVTLAAFRLPEN